MNIDIGKLHQELCDIAFDSDINTLLEQGYYLSAGKKYFPTNDDRANAFSEALRDLRSLLADPRWADLIDRAMNIDKIAEAISEALLAANIPPLTAPDLRVKWADDVADVAAAAAVAAMELTQERRESVRWVSPWEQP